jgi:polyisoprenoid-binding protein YceI
VAAAGEPAPVAPAAPVPPPPSGPVTYKLDSAKSFVGVQVWIDPSGLGSTLGHDHVIVASRFSGSVTWDPQNLATCKVSVTVPVANLVVDPPGARKRVGLEGETPEADKATITANFTGKDQLWIEKYPEISFKGSKCRAEGEKVLVDGEFTMRGVTKPVTMKMKVDAKPGSYAASGGFTTTHTNFGFSPFKAAMGMLKNQDKLAFVLDVKGTP